MKYAIIFALLAVILTGGTITPAISQEPSFATNIVINEIEINPPGPDSRTSSSASSSITEFVELYNPTSDHIDVSGWQIVPTKIWKSHTLPNGSIIPPNDHLVIAASSYWFNDVSEFVTLKNETGVIIDQTPLLDDPGNDLSTWQRVYDGLDTDNTSDWILKGTTAAATNGSYVPAEVIADLTISLELDKEQYNFNEKVNISGSVSELAYDNEFSSTTFIPELVTIFISGPSSFNETITVYPDTNLQFSTSLSLYSVLGYSDGEYLVTASYSTVSMTKNFSLGEIDESIAAESISSELTISTNKPEYEPGELVEISASTNNTISFVGLQYTISDANGRIVGSGSIFPDTNNEFKTNYFIPVSVDAFGVYQVFANYKFTTNFSQTGDSQAAFATFNVVEDVKEDKVISVWTDKDIYTPGETVHITGRSNSIHVDTFDIHIQQTGIQTGFSGNDAAARSDPLNHWATVRLDGDNRFEFDLPITAIDARLGSYQISAGENFGKGYGYFKVVENPDTYVASQITPLGLATDKAVYELNEKIAITGIINNFQLSEAQSITFQQVQISFKDPKGHSLKHEVRVSSASDEYEEQLFLFTSIPDNVGFFRNQVTLDSVTFSPGIYTIKAVYQNIHDSVKFEILSNEAIALAAVSDEELEPPITINVSSDVYEVGDTAIITGKVLPMDLVRERSEVSKFEELGRDDHYRPKEGTHVDYTNYALNFVKVTIPYPITLQVDPQSEFTTTTVDGSIPGGGCGASAGAECVGHGSYDGIVKYREILKKLEPFSSKVYPDEDGNFKVEYELRGGVFEEGTYSVEAEYFGEKIDTTIRVVDNRFALGGSPEISVTTDKEQYKPGEIVEITGMIENVYYFDPIGIIVNPPDQSGINCLKMYCGEGNVVKKLKIGGYYSDSPNLFGMTYNLPKADYSLGQYTVIADTKFGIAETTFIVTENPILQNTAEPIVEKVKETKIFDKVNRISTSSIPISVKQKTGNDNNLEPRVVQGSLFTSARGEESNVNLQVSTKNGACIIGQESGCVISESTREPGTIYKILKIGGNDYKVRYSGPDVRLEKFSIVSVEDNIPLKILDWDVNVIKDEQPSRFYYKISYVNLE